MLFFGKKIYKLLQHRGSVPEPPIASVS